ncbi:MAG: hypothetical protein EAZ24_15850 [Burkholderiales bacterium]|nr:MAG: hypothetical protein EAZ24_15850 [Burkholderiales bacterium]
MSLFQLIHERGGTASSAGAKLGEGLRCLSCGDGMKTVNDRVKGTRFVYQSCRHGHGRLTTFYNFLSEKQFVRELTQAERTKLCATVRQVQCSGCGAPVDLSKHDACAYCRAPISVFDRDAARKAIDHYLRERHKQVPNDRPSIEYGHSPRSRERWDAWDTLYAADLASDLLWALGRAATRGISRAAAPIGGLSAGSVLADAHGADSGLANLPGGLMDSLQNGALANSGIRPEGATGTSLETATDVLFGSAAALRESNFAASTAAEVLNSPAALSAIPSASDALFGAQSGSLFDAASSSGELTTDAIESVGSIAGDVGGGIGESVGDIAEASEGGVDLVADGVGSLIAAIFD